MKTQILIPKPIGFLRHKPTNTNISVYNPINRWHKFWIKLFFGLEYYNYNNKNNKN